VKKKSAKKSGSMDDFYLLGEQQMAVIETTNQCLDKEEVRKYVKTDSVITPFRAVVANR
jgi:hypothetical protein